MESAGEFAGSDDLDQFASNIAADCPRMIEHIVPPEVVCFATRGDDVIGSLFPDEAAQMRGAVDKRLREFTTGRSCARLAIGYLGLPPTAILRGSCREPIWPCGVVGSITHCSGYRAAAVALQRDVLAIGIDAETDEKLPPGTLEQIAVAEECTWLAAARPGVNWDRLLFSAKESLFKAWFPLARTWLGFDQAIVLFDPTECTFRVQLLVSLPAAFGDGPRLFSGRFIVRDGLLLTAIVVSR